MDDDEEEGDARPRGDDDEGQEGFQLCQTIERNGGQGGGGGVVFKKKKEKINCQSFENKTMVGTVVEGLNLV